MKKILIMILVLMLTGSALAASAPQAVSRGGTIVIQIPWAWINSAEMGSTWWGGIYQGENDTMEEVLFGILPPSEVASKILGGGGSYTIRTFGFNGVDSKALNMSSRPLDDAWYCVVRPEGKVSDSFKMHSTVMEYSLTIQDNEVSGNLEQEKQDQSPVSVPVTSMDDLKADWKKDFGGFKMSLFHVQEVYIAVIQEEGVKQDDLAYTQLYVNMAGLYDFAETYIQLEGYMDGDEGVYCCVLSEAEAGLLMKGTSARLEHDHAKG